MTFQIKSVLVDSLSPHSPPPDPVLFLSLFVFCLGFFVVIVVFLDGVSLCCSGCPRIHYIDQIYPKMLLPLLLSAGVSGVVSHHTAGPSFLSVFSLGYN